MCSIFLYHQRYDPAAKSQLKKITKIFHQKQRKAADSERKEV